MSTIQVICRLIIILTIMTIPVLGKSLQKRRTHLASDNSSDYMYYSYNRPVMRMNINAAGTTRRPPINRKYYPRYPFKNGEKRMFSDFNVAMDNDMRIRNLMEELVLKSRLVDEYDIFERMENDLELKTNKNRHELTQTAGGDVVVKIRNDFVLPEYGKTEENANVKTDTENIYSTQIKNISTEPPDLFLTSDLNKTVLKEQLDFLQLNAPKINNREDLSGIKSSTRTNTNVKTKTYSEEIVEPDFENSNLKATTQKHSKKEKIQSKNEFSSNYDSHTNHPLTQIVRPIFYSNSITTITKTLPAIDDSVPEYAVTSDSYLQRQTPQTNTEFEDTPTNLMSKVTDELTNVDETTRYFETVQPTESTETFDIGITNELKLETTTEAVSTTISSEDDNMRTTIFIHEALENTTSFPISNVNEDITEWIFSESNPTNNSLENFQAENILYNNRNNLKEQLSKPENVQPTLALEKLDEQVDKRLNALETTIENILPNQVGFMQNVTIMDGDHIELSIYINKTNNDNFSSIVTTGSPLLQRKVHPEKLDEDVIATINCHTSLAEKSVEAVELGDKNNYNANNPAILRTNNYGYDNIAEPNGQSNNETSHLQDIAGHEKSNRKSDDADKDSDEDDVEDENEIKTAQMSVNEKEMLNIFKKDNNNTYEYATAQDKNEALATLDETAGEYDNHYDELDADSSEDGVYVEVYDDVKVSNDDNVGDDDEDNAAEEVVSNVSEADTTSDADDNGQAADVEAPSTSAESDNVIDRTPLNGGRDGISYERRSPDTQKQSRNDTMFTEREDDDALARLPPSTLPSPQSPRPKTVQTEASTSHGDTTAYSAALKQILSDPDIKTTNWWHSLSYAEIRNFLNTIFDTAAHELYEDFVRKSKEVQSGKRPTLDERMKTAFATETHTTD